MIEHDDVEIIGFRIELGRVMDIFWASPARDSNHLRLVHVDSAAYHVETEIEADPFIVDLPPMVWDGALAELADGGAIVRVEIELVSSPVAYRCEVTTRNAKGALRTAAFAGG